MGIDAQMFVRHRNSLSERQVQVLAWELAEAFGHEKFWIFNPVVTGHDYTRRALEISDHYLQDGDPIVPECGEQFIEVSLSTRYYGVGYERGDLPFIIAVAQWLEARISGCSVWYGGDSSGVCAEPFDALAREKLMQHFIAVGHLPYQGDPREKAHDNPFISQSRFNQPHCDFCDQPMLQRGFGSNYAGFWCLGCDYKVETRDNGLTWQVPEKKVSV